MRRRRNKRNPNRRSHPFMTLFLISGLAVGSGFLGVRYVVSPWMERQSDTTTVSMTEEVPEITELPKNPEKDETIVEDKIDTVTTKAFAVQLGSFSTREAAEQRVKELKEQGIAGTVQERDNAWKVVSEGFSTKEEAKAAATRWRDVIGDAFVVGI